MTTSGHGGEATEAPALRQENYRWVWRRRWEIFFWRTEAILWVPAILISTSSAVSVIVREGFRSEGLYAWGFCLLGIFILRLLRAETLGVAVLPDRLLVSRALSLHPHEIPLDEIGCCVSWRCLGADHLFLYLKPRWRAPVMLLSSRLLGIPREHWGPLMTELRELFEPLGRWKRFPWWRQPSWL